MPVIIAVLLVIALVILFIYAAGLVLNLLWLALIGLLIGALARLIVPGRQMMGWLSTALYGVAGSLIGGLIAEAAELGGIAQFVIAVVTAAVLVALFVGRDSNTRVID